VKKLFIFALFIAKKKFKLLNKLTANVEMKNLKMKQIQKVQYLGDF